ncbi:hypothetical protein FEM48_Zijuj10G0165400 [Ziziphus jujuba var. spinosa]|uniref:Serpin domain-containing protein n=1 Tax=Ziziphus jujuba var. spinosa TaxID=714518 RepID=A0A978UPH3_ZIZJJ|nr:hypothetical protein FEM48_Zijuj10G0165400 [Ziziphus jujuba var. spinosa]
MEFCVKLAAEGILEEVIKDQGKNVVMSPTSMNLLLNMAALGSSGDTLKQFLGYHTYTFKPSFKEEVRNIYKTEPETVDFINQAENVINEVNSWAEKSTKGLIKDFLPPSIQLKPPLLLANALYFKATCKDQFKASLTRDFHLLAGKTIKVPFMTQVEQKQRYGSFKDFQVVRLYYDTGGCYHYDNDHPSFCMDIILPDRRNGLQDLLQKFNSDTELVLRDFEDLELMEKLGLTLPFNYKLADFTETIHSPLGKQLFIDKMFQKSCIEVDEEGTEGASVSGGLGFGGRSMYCQAPEVEFVADHPFMFIIREEVSGAVIFTGAAENMRNEVNSWAENSTNGLTEDYLPRLVKLEPPLLLANALCFKGAWRDPFIALSAWYKDFHHPDGKTIEVPFLTPIE